MRLFCILGRHKWKAPVATLRNSQAQVYVECQHCGKWWVDAACYTTHAAMLTFQGEWKTTSGWAAWQRCVALGTVKDERAGVTP